jgi:hypothetical protein
MGIDCKDHTPITVKVKSSECLKGIDPMDWYK